jgi:peptidoglycan LD-endopeptidase CwlK
MNVFPMTREAALQGSAAPPEILSNQELLSLPFLDFKGQQQSGQIVVARELAQEVTAIFAEIYAAKFPIFQMVPVVAFGWSDDDSMEANNCSAFNYRLKVGKSEPSVHSWGRALDINPRQNPYIRGEIVLPQGAVYNPRAFGTILAEGPVVRAFESRGWIWGGRWDNPYDYHHFEKPVS